MQGWPPRCKKRISGSQHETSAFDYLFYAVTILFHIWYFRGRCFEVGSPRFQPIFTSRAASPKHRPLSQKLFESNRKHQPSIFASVAANQTCQTHPLTCVVCACCVQCRVLELNCYWYDCPVMCRTQGLGHIRSASLLESRLKVSIFRPLQRIQLRSKMLRLKYCRFFPQ